MRVFEIAVAVGFAIAAYGVLVRRRWTRVRRIEIELPRLPPRFDGYRIVQLSDVHVGTMNRARSVEKWVQKTNALDADVVAVTGDLLSSGTAFHDEAIDALGGLRARDAVIGCLGNHDYYSEDALCRGLEARGLRMLRNRGFAIERENETIFLAGVEDYWRGSPDLDAATRGANGAPVVLLAHNPDYFPVAREAGVALTLSGHTHAGQIAVPFAVEMLNLSRIAVRWSAGVYRDGEAILFVHAGLGTTGPAIRIGAAPEIVEITLRRAA
jgi:predicted MPP superfamily phosphohydrolase